MCLRNLCWEICVERNRNREEDDWEGFLLAAMCVCVVICDRKKGSGEEGESVCGARYIKH